MAQALSYFCCHS